MQIIGFGIKRVTDYFVGIYSNLNSCRHLQTKLVGFGNLTNFNGQLLLSKLGLKNGVMKISDEKKALKLVNWIFLSIECKMIEQFKECIHMRVLLIQ